MNVKSVTEVKNRGVLDPKKWQYNQKSSEGAYG